MYKATLIEMGYEVWRDETGCHARKDGSLFTDTQWRDIVKHLRLTGPRSTIWGYYKGRRS